MSDASVSVHTLRNSAFPFVTVRDCSFPYVTSLFCFFRADRSRTLQFLFCFFGGGRGNSAGVPGAWYSPRVGRQAGKAGTRTRQQARKGRTPARPDDRRTPGHQPAKTRTRPADTVGRQARPDARTIGNDSTTARPETPTARQRARTAGNTSTPGRVRNEGRETCSMSGKIKKYDYSRFAY